MHSQLFSCLLCSPTLVGKVLSFTHELSVFLSFLFYESTALSIVAQWMAIKCISAVRSSFVGTASTIEISPNPSLIFTGVGSKCAKFGIVFNHSTLSSSSLVKSGPRTPENRLSVVPTPKIARRKRAKSSTNQPWIIRFRSNFVQSFSA